MYLFAYTPLELHTRKAKIILAPPEGALCVQVIRLRVSYNRNDETLSRNSLRYLSKANSPIAVHFGLYTILQLPILYGVWHTQGGSGGESYIAQYACNSIATVWGLDVGGWNEITIASCTNDFK